jgi:hypothetical protein
VTTGGFVPAPDPRQGYTGNPNNAGGGFTDPNPPPTAPVAAATTAPAATARGAQTGQPLGPDTPNIGGFTYSATAARVGYWPAFN